VIARSTRAALAFACSLAGCFNPDVQEGQFRCSPDDTRCPSGFACDPCTNLCRSPEHVCQGGSVDLSTSLDGATRDLARADSSTVIDLAMRDQSTANDMATAMDDMPMTLPDLTMAPDLAIAPDLSIAPDLVILADLTQFPDMVCADNGAACNGKSCGTAVNNCGNTVSCGSCPLGQVCNGNQCVQCNVDGDCTTGTPWCNNHQCVQCNNDNQCKDGGWGDTCSNGVCLCTVNLKDCANPRAPNCVAAFMNVGVCECSNQNLICPNGQTCINGGCQ